MSKNGSRKIVFSGLAVLTLALAGFMVGCSGNTDGGDATDTSGLGGEFVDTDSATGYIELDVENQQLSVSETSSFRVWVKNSSGEAVPQMRVSCDTESGLALLEPTTGTEMTDETGQMSGVLGCSAPGSLQVGCRLAQGAYKRKFATIKCAGPVPAGFSGFPNAAGGGLGGGVDTNGNGGVGGTNPEGIRITSIDFLDQNEISDGATGTHSLDVIQTMCGTNCSSSGSSCTAEPFFDTSVRIAIENNTNQNVRCTSMRYSVPEGTGASTSTVNSSSINFIGEASSSDTAASDGGTATFFALFLDATDPPVSPASAVGGKKFYATGASSIADDFGFRNITFRLSCTNELGDAITLTSTVGISLDNFGHC